MNGWGCGGHDGCGSLGDGHGGRWNDNVVVITLVLQEQIIVMVAKEMKWLAKDNIAGGDCSAQHDCRFGCGAYRH
jgi:hypothetical protein